MKLSYIGKHIVLTDISAQYQKEFGVGKPVACVFGKVRNDGPETLTSVEVRAYFLDDSGRRIYEKSYHPVLVSSLFGGDDTPLKPGYIRKFGFKSDDCPSEWAEGRVEVGVTDIEFASNGRQDIR